MCGIVGYTGQREAAEILLEGLEKLEYRGYDSAGLAVLSPGGRVSIAKAKGRLEKLVEKTSCGRTLPGMSGIGHTRWATHGEPNENNAHPHASDDYGNCIMFPADALEDGKTPVFTSNNTEIESQDETLSKIA